MWITRLVALITLGGALWVFFSTFRSPAADAIWRRFRALFFSTSLIALVFLLYPSSRQEEPTTPSMVPVRERSASDEGRTRGPEPPPSLPWYSESRALIVGISHYVRGWQPLPGVEEDVRLVTQALEAHEFKVESELNLDSSQFDQRIIKFINTHGSLPNNRLLLYFAGHGYSDASPPRSSTPVGYFILTDTPYPPERNLPNFRQHAFSMQRIIEYVGRIDAKHVLFIFDSCFSGALFAIQRSPAVPESIQIKTSKPARQFITSGRAGERVPDSSIFRAAFIDIVTTGAGDTDCDGYVTGTELGAFLYRRVAEQSQGRQHPQYGALRDDELQGDFVLRVAQETVQSPPCPKPEPPESGVSETSDPDPVVVGINIRNQPLRVRKSDIQRVVELSRHIPITAVNDQITEAEVRELAQGFGLLERTRVNPNLRFLGGDISYWGEQGLTLDEMKLQFAARKTVLDAADREGVKIVNQGTLSHVAAQVMAALASAVAPSSESKESPSGSTSAPSSEAQLTMSAFHSDRYIEGKVEGIAPEEYKNYQVLAYVFTDKWYIHPWAENREGRGFATIQNDATWKLPTVWRGHQAYRVAFLLTERSLEPPSVIEVSSGDRNQALLTAVPSQAHLILKAPPGI